MPLPSDMAAIDAEIFDDLGEKLVFGTTEVMGIFHDSFITPSGGENQVEGRSIVFECREADLPNNLEEGDTVVRTLNSSTYRYLARGETDESGLCTVFLGST